MRTDLLDRVSATLTACLVALGGCAAQVDTDEATEVAGEVPGGEVRAVPPPVDRPELLARLERGRSSVEWIAKRGDKEGAVVLRGRTGDLPLIDMDGAEKMRPVELYLALAGREQQIPERMATLATDADRALVADPAALASLRRRTAQRAADLQARIEAETPELQPFAGSCTAAEVATARSVYGLGYSSSETCGDHLGFVAASRSFFYCNDNGEEDCDYDLGQLDGASCPLHNPCDYATGTLNGAKMRSNTTGNPHWFNNAHRIRGFAYNCQGNGDLTMQIRYGAGGWDIDVDVPVNTHSGVLVWSTHNLPALAPAISRVADGHIDDDLSASGSTYQPIEYLVSNNTAANDRGIFCSDVQQSLSVEASSLPSVCGHGLVSWCNGPCGGACFE